MNGENLIKFLQRDIRDIKYLSTLIKMIQCLMGKENKDRVCTNCKWCKKKCQ